MTSLVRRNRGFAAVWGAQLCSQAAIRMFQVGVIWWLVGHVASGRAGLASGMLMLAGTIPPVLLAPVIARTLARLPSRRVLRGALVAAAVTAALVTAWVLAAGLSVAAVYPAALLLATCQAFFDPGLTQSVPEVVDDADIEAATGFELSSQPIAGLAGAFAGPIMVDRIGLTGLLAGCTLAYAAGAALLGLARFRTTHSEGEPPPPHRSLRKILAGLPFVRSVLLTFAAANLFSTAVFVIYPLYTRNVLHAGGITFALCEAGLGLGTLVGAFTGARVRGSLTNVGAACLTGLAAAYALPGLVPNAAVAVGSLIVAGWCVGVVGVRFVAAFQRLVPDEDRAGFFAVMQSLLGVTFPVASLVFGILGDHVSPRTLCLVQAAGLVPVALGMWLLRSRDPARIPAPQEAAV